MCFRILFLTSVGFEGYELPNTRTVSVLVATVTLPDRSVCSWPDGYTGQVPLMNRVFLTQLKGSPVSNIFLWSVQTGLLA